MLVMMGENLAGFRRMGIRLATVPGGEQGVTRGGGGILRLEIAFRLAMMICGLLVMVRGVVMVACRRMFAGHAHPPMRR